MENTEKKTVLIIDDDLAILNVIRNQLKSYGITIVAASNRMEALAALEARHVNAVLCDIKMKEESGFVVIKAIREKFPLLPVIVLTGFIGQEYYDQAKELQCLEMVIKPVRKENLLKVLEKAFLINN